MLVAVVGAGAGGLASIKNCLEEGHDVIAFEKDASVLECHSHFSPRGLGSFLQWVAYGGYKENDTTVTTIMENTVANISKHRVAFSDFPLPDDCPLFPPASWMISYIESYAKHFGLLPKIKFSTIVTSISFAPTSNSHDTRFAIKYKSSLSGSSDEENTIEVDRVMIATGAQSQPSIPHIEGIEHFKGDVSHTSGFRNGAPFKGKNVLVVGSRSSAADTCVLLATGGAENIYMSHRGGVQLISRLWQGKPFDYLLTRRVTRIQAAFEGLVTYASGYIQNVILDYIRGRTFKYAKEWGFLPTPDTRATVPTITDDLYPLLQSGRVEPVPGIASISPDSSVVLSDGRVLTAIDSIIYATGYRSDPAATVPLAPDILEKMGYDPATPFRFPRYRYTLSALLPEVCFLGIGYTTTSGPLFVDIRSMWIASVWSRNVKLPDHEAMMKQSRKEAKWADGLRKFGSVTPGTMPIENFFTMAAEAGCEDDHTSWFSCSWEGWKWWWNNRALSRLIMDGPDLPASHRLRGRKQWGWSRRRHLEG